MLTIFGLLPGMNHLEKWWAIMSLIFIKLLIELPYYKKIMLFLIVLSVDSLKIPIIILLYHFVFIFLSIVNKYTFNTNILSKNYRLHCNYMCNKCLNIKYSGYNIPKDPTIFICNYPANLIEYLLYYSCLNEKCCIVAFKGAKIAHTIEIFFGKNSVVIVGKGGDFEKTQNAIKDKIKEGYNIMVYNEKNFFNRYNMYHVSKLRTGIFSIAKNLNITVTPIVFDHISNNFGFVTNKKFKIYIGKTEKVQDVEKDVKKLRSLFLRKLRMFKIK